MTPEMSKLDLFLGAGMTLICGVAMLLIGLLSPIVLWISFDYWKELFK